ncbi:hypothetical protein PHET_03901 [Paragonimus heterotremus]|uniref:Ion transport domain-containing protein n=1 Tax=Paragonimus heterotremus TaxID=100268 RepID=A0A8J4T9I6_9TREM|nr:hypothetical protein PHET_03901 [Paragonimus heterotremus]
MAECPKLVHQSFHFQMELTSFELNNSPEDAGKNLLESKSEEGKTPLMYALCNGSCGVLKYLLQMNANYRATDNDGDNVFYYLPKTKDCGSWKSYELLLQYVEEQGQLSNMLNAKNNQGRTPLHRAAIKGLTETFKLLIRKDGVDPHVQDDSGRSYLHLIVRHADLEAVEEALRLTGEIDVRDEDLESPLFYAVRENLSNVVELLIARKCDVNLQNDELQTPIMIACLLGHTELVPTLYNNGARLDNRDIDEENALLYAIRSKSIDLVKLKTNRGDLLKHDLVRAFLAHKSARLFIPFLTSFIFYALLLAVYSVYMFQNTPPYMHDTGTSGVEYDATNETRNLQKLCSLLRPAKWTTELSKYGLMILALLSLLKEVVQFVLYKRNYFTWENAIEISIYVLAFLITVDTNECMHVTGLREHWQWQSGTIGLMLAWVNLPFFVQRIPFLGVYVSMFKLVLRNLVILLMIFSPFIVAFMMTFHLLLMNQLAFKHRGDALSKIMVMISGEVEFENTMFKRYEQPNAEEYMVYYERCTYALFIVFIIIMPIALTNTLTGIAVGEVSSILREAAMSKLRLTIRTIVSTNELFKAMNVFSSFGICEPLPKFCERKPNLSRFVNKTLFHWFYEFGKESDQVSRAMVVNELTPPTG